MKVNPREKGAASHLSCVGWFSRALAFRSLYYPWAKMGTTRSLIRRAGVVQWWEHSLPPMWPGFKSRRRRYMWVEFVVGSLLCSERFFFGCSGFPLSSKPNISKFQFDQESGRRRTFDKEFFKLIKNSIFYKSIYSVCVKWSWRTKESFKVRCKAWFILMKRD